MFEWWKDLVRSVRTTDPQFGNLRYLRDARFREGHAAFSPIAAEVEVLIPGEPSGPADKQRAFFNEIQTRSDSLWPEILRVLETEARRRSRMRWSCSLSALNPYVNVSGRDELARTAGSPCIFPGSHAPGSKAAYGKRCVGGA